MKNIQFILSTAAVALLIASCGDSNSVESKKAELEKLKVQQGEIAAKIATLNSEILSLGDSSNIQEDRSKMVILTPIAKQTFVNGVDVQGSVDGDENITYTAKVPSVVTNINVKVGQKISAGQILAELDNKVVRAQLDGMKKQYELIKTLYDKRKELWDQKIGSEIEFLQAKNQKESLEKQIDALKENLDMYYIKADYSGTVDGVFLKVGQNVAPGVPAITVVNPEALKVKAQLSEAYLSSVKTGDDVNITFPDIQKNIKAKVSYASKTIDKMSRTFNVEINLPKNDDLHPNMVAEIQIINYRNTNAFVVPINTIQQIDNQNVVFLAVNQDGKLVAKKVAVTIGKQYNGVSEILAGLNEGDNLISVGFQDLTDGQSVKQ